MAKIVLRRKTYGLVEAAGNTIGGVAQGVGQALDSKPAAMAGGLAGGAVLGGSITSAATSALAGLGGVAATLSNPLGWLVGAGIGAAATRGLGKGLKEASSM